MRIWTQHCPLASLWRLLLSYKESIRTAADRLSSLLWYLQEIDELYKIFMKLGTPDENVWPGVRNLPDWKETFPKWRSVSFKEICPDLDPLGLELLSRMLVYDPQLRITARQALSHPYFHDIAGMVAQPLRL